jgi:hypothetical protein
LAYDVFESDEGKIVFHLFAFLKLSTSSIIILLHDPFSQKLGWQIRKQGGNLQKLRRDIPNDAATTCYQTYH